MITVSTKKRIVLFVNVYLLLSVFTYYKTNCFSASQLVKDNQLIKLLRDSSVNLLRNIALSAGLCKDNLHRSTVHGLSSLFCTSLNSSSSEWCNLTLVRSICQTHQLSRAFSTKPWTNMLLGYLAPPSAVGGNDVNLPKQVRRLY